jgi:glycosyltransferase involved in cell wall biosynthesis
MSGLLERAPEDATLAILRMECFAPGDQGALVNEGGFTAFVDSLAPHFRRIEVVAPVVPRLTVSAGLRGFRAPNVVLRELPDMKGLARCWLRSGAALARLQRWADGWDLVNLRAPDNFLPASAAWLRRRGIPHYLQLVSHPVDAGDAATSALPGPLRPLGRLAWRLQRRAIRRACEGRLCIAHGEALRAIAAGWGAEAHNLPSGSLSRAWVDPRPRSGRPRRLLFVGRLNTEKGLEQLVDALVELEDLDLAVTLAGWSTGPYAERLVARARRAGVAERLDLVGPVPHGAELFDLYRSHDLFVLPSVSEGTPRVLGEALAFGLPVAATTAGGIPDLIEHGVTGLLSAPGDAVGLARSLRRLIEDAELRHRLVSAAAETVDGRTLEHKAEQHVALLRGESLAPAGQRPQACSTEPGLGVREVPEVRGGAA